MEEGEPAVDFCLPDMDEREVCLHHLRDKWVVLYFYPKDNTVGCTREAREFSSHISVLEKNACCCYRPRSHKKFIEKHTKFSRTTACGRKRNCMGENTMAW